MKPFSNQAIFIFVTILVITLLYLLAPIMTPFLLGALLAYLVNPLVKRLEKWHLPHLLSVILIFLFLFSATTLLISFLYPHIIRQIEVLFAMIPQLIEWTKTVGMPWLLQFINMNTLKSSLPSTLSKTGWVVTAFVHSSFAAIQLIISIVLTPVVTFYLLRDWDRILDNIKNLLPAQSAHSIIQLARDCDEVLSAFIRGQLIVMLCLGLIYGIGLSIVGLRLGLIIGLIGGLLSIVPYLGSLFVVIAASITAFLQTGTYESILYVLIVFVIGQAIEGYILTPYLIGERIGLHPVAVIFSIMAGGTLFGFFGILLALPVAAVLMAIARFFSQRYYHT
ncbi:MAG: AI-2E family transporter [Gammaproteobacteria bacterium]|nr:AI-2E family transporter [Gammaproteobacteria bacterium]MCW5583844.1 AI-2E family transporter [Gammaproteobacteria bacterium]